MTMSPAEFFPLAAGVAVHIREFVGDDDFLVGATSDWPRREREHIAEGWQRGTKITPVESFDDARALVERVVITCKDWAWHRATAAELDGDGPFAIYVMAKPSLVSSMRTVGSRSGSSTARSPRRAPKAVGR